MTENDMHIAPVWLTNEYMQRILRASQRNQTIKIVELRLTPATEKGENYASIMTRIQVQYTAAHSKDIQHGYYIAKSTYESNAYAFNIIKPYKTFETEMFVYAKILPKLAMLFNEINENDEDNGVNNEENANQMALFAKTIYIDYENTAIIFEDLAVKKFILADRLIGFDLEHTLMVLKNLAKMHAAAAVLNERNPELYINQLDHGIFNRHTRNFAPFFENMIAVCAEYAATAPKLGVYYTEKLMNLKPYVVEYATRVYDQQNGHFHTLNHGDFWLNNIMFNYAQRNDGSKRIDAIKLIDFQFSSWTSPAIDLHYFLNTSLSGELRFQQQSTLIQYYHQMLVKTLKKLHYDGYIPTLHEFIVQMECAHFYAVTSSLVVQPMLINENTENAEFNSLLQDDEFSLQFRKRLYNNKKIQNYIEVLLPFFDRRGLLDIDE